jgi:soluble lytic murein transglycosylase
MHRLRPRFVLAILAALTAAAALASMLWPAVPPVPRPLVHVALVDPYAQPPLDAYGAVQLAQRTGDRDALRVLADHAEGFLALRLALWLARDPELPASERLGWYERVLELRIDDPLERAARRALHAEVGAVAEEAGYDPRAITAYREALPNQAAIDGLERLERDPYRLANAFLQARMSTRALAALGGRAAPSIEAPALRAVGRHEAALDAFRRWLVEVPGSREALEGIAWSLFSLERWREADAAFATVGGATGTYGRGLVAAREGRITDAVALMMATGRSSDMWLATGWLEARNRVTEAIDAYLRIAAVGDAVYADDAAYRALVLARRLGDDATAARAEAAIPDGSFFALRLGRPLDVPRGPTPGSDPLAASATTREALDLARALMIVGDPEAARGELAFALRAAPEREDAILLAEGLQQIGEFRQSQRAAQAWLNAGDRDPRVWRLAYPLAYPESTLVHAASFDLEPALVWAVMRQESAFSPVAVSTSNAQGLMQVIPSTWDWLAELQRERPGDPFDPDTNVRYGSYYLRWLLNYFGGDVELAIASYNRGQGYIRRLFEGELVASDKDDLFRHIDALETREYLQRVTLHLETYRALYGGAERLALTP